MAEQVAALAWLAIITDLEKQRTGRFGTAQEAHAGATAWFEARSGRVPP